MRHRATAAFWSGYESLPPTIRALADKKFALLKENPRHPSLHFKCVGDDLWSAHVGLDYRALALKEVEGFTWIWIGNHEHYERILRKR